MPSLAAIPAVKPDKNAGLDVPESFKSVVTVVEKKCRNLEKRKTKLDGYREELAKGRGLAEDQKLAVARYDEVIATLDLSREFITAFDKIAVETSKEEKKRKKREIFEKQQSELVRFKELFTIQEVFSCLCSEAAREDFLNGFRGAPQLNDAEILKLDTFFRLVSIDRQNLPGSFTDSISNTATYFQQLLEGRNKEVAGSTYRELKELILRIVDNGYFDWKPEPEPEPVIEEPEPVVAAPEVVEPEPTPSTFQEIPEACPPHINSGIEMVEPVPIPVMPQVPAATYFPVDAETNFNFIQESMIIEPEPVIAMNPSVPTGMAVPSAVPVSLASMDSAVVMVHSQVPAHFYMPGYTVTPQSMVHPTSLPSVDVPVATNESSSEIPAVTTAAALEPVAPVDVKKDNTTNPPWDEEPTDDMVPYQEQSRNESNTWTNSNYRPNDQEPNGRRGGYRGRGNRGGPRGGSGGAGFFNSRNYGERHNQGGERNHQQGGERSYQGNNGGGGDRSYQGNNGGGGGDRSYQGNNGGGERSYQGNNGGGGGGNYRGNRGSWNGSRGSFRGTSRGGPRGGSSNRGGYERNSAPQAPQARETQ